MSQLEAVAGQLRALAKSTEPISANVEAAAGRLRAIAARLESIKRSGVDTRALDGAILNAEAHAQKAADAVRQLQAEGTQWADQLASGGGSGTETGQPSAGEHTGGVTGSQDGSVSRAARLAAIKDFSRKVVRSFFSTEVLRAVLPKIAGEAAGAVTGNAGAGESVELIVDTAWNLVEAGATAYVRGTLSNLVRRVRKE